MRKRTRGVGECGPTRDQSASAARPKAAMPARAPAVLERALLVLAGAAAELAPVEELEAEEPLLWGAVDVAEAEAVAEDWVAADGVLVNVTPTAAQRFWARVSAAWRSAPWQALVMQAVEFSTKTLLLQRQALSLEAQPSRLTLGPDRQGRAQLGS